MKFFFLRSLRVRLLLLVLVAVIPALGAIAYTASEQKKIAVAEIQRNVLRLVEFSTHEEEQVLQGTRQILIVLAYYARKADKNPSDCNAFCADILKQFKRYANIGVVKPSGDVFCSAIPLQEPTNAADHGSSALWQAAILPSVIIKSAGSPENRCWC